MTTDESTSTVSAPPTPPLRARGAWLVLLIACGASFTELLDASIVNVALFTIRNDLGLSDLGLQWVVNAYLLAFGGLLLLGGRAADMFGIRRMLVVGLVVFIAASLLGGLAMNGAWLVAARAGQGVGAAIIAPTTLAILTTYFTDPKQRAGAIGAWITAGVVGAALGSLIGGLLTDLLDWRWVLWINVPVGLLLLAGTLVGLREIRRPAQRPGFDLAGAAAVTAGLLLVVLGAASTSSYGWGSPRTLVPLLGGVALLVAFVAIERRVRTPIVPLDIFRLRTVSAGNAVAFLANAASLPMYYLLGLFLQDVYGFSPLQAGLAFLPLSFSIVMGSFAGSMLLPKVGPRPPMLAGAAIAAAGQVWLSLAPDDGSYPVHVLVPTILMGIGIGAIFVPATSTATAGVAEERSGLASGLVNTANQFGGALGVAVLATFAASFATAAAGYTNAMLLAAGVVLLAGVAAFSAPRALPEGAGTP
ncbi:MFS transporter [Micromonospora echinaurantiaca]|uniref:MFS transporter n=1 Tax=Micromonospora echinaurantiaca TaxID=47857 RepID=UPI00370FD1A6